MIEMISARYALNSIIAFGRPIHEAASFLSEQAQEGRVHAWGIINMDGLRQIQLFLWPYLRWTALPNEDGIIEFDNGNGVSIVGNWLDGRISWRDDKASAVYSIEGLRFDRISFEEVSGKAINWNSLVIGASRLAQHTEEDMRMWIIAAPSSSADKAHMNYQANPLHYPIKQPEFRELWKELRGTKRGRPRGSLSKP